MAATATVVLMIGRVWMTVVGEMTMVITVVLMTTMMKWQVMLMR